MFDFYAIKHLSDETTTYNIRLDKEYTVRAFVETVLKERSREWGRIKIRPDEGRDYVSSCDYQYGRLVTEPVSDKLLDKVVKRAMANGGWSAMDYVLYVEG